MDSPLITVHPQMGQRHHVQLRGSIGARPWSWPPTFVPVPDHGRARSGPRTCQIRTTDVLAPGHVRASSGPRTCSFWTTFEQIDRPSSTGNSTRYRGMVPPRWPPECDSNTKVAGTSIVGTMQEDHYFSQNRCVRVSDFPSTVRRWILIRYVKQGCYRSQTK